MRKMMGAVLLLVLSGGAQAGRPLATEDAGVIDAGGVELESYFSRFSERDEAPVFGRNIQPSVGVGFGTQFGVGFGHSTQSGSGGAERQISLSGKTSIKTLTDQDWGLALAYGVSKVRSPSEDDEESPRYRYSGAAVNAAFTLPRGDWNFHANLGWQREHLAHRSLTNWALAAERKNAVGPVDLALETYGNDQDPAWLGVAARWSVIDERLFLDSSYAMQLSSTRARQWTLGLKLAF